MRTATHRTWLVISALLLCALAQGVFAIDAGEITALEAIRAAYSEALSHVVPPWSGITSSACGTQGFPAWYGVTCDSSGHVISLVLPSAGLSGPISPAIGDLVHLRQLGLRGNQLSGTVPQELGSLVNLTTLDLSLNKLHLCDSNATQFRDGQFTSGCNVRDQETVCYGPCCGCGAAWVQKGCLQTLPPCADCMYSRPVSLPYTDVYCSNGQWVIQGPYRGTLEMDGPVTVLGDLIVPPGQPLLFKGLRTVLNVTGSLDAQYSSMMIGLLEEDVTMTADYGKRNSRIAPNYGIWYQAFINVAHPLPKYGGKASLVRSCGRRSCRGPGDNVIAVIPAKRCRQPTDRILRDNSYQWIVSFRPYNSCQLALGLGLGLGLGLPVLFTLIVLWNVFFH